MSPDLPLRQDVDLRDLIAILARRWRAIAFCTAAMLVLALGYLATASTVFTANVSILIDPRVRPTPGADAQQTPSAGPDPTLVESQGKLIASDAILRRVAQKEGLAEDPDFVGGAPGLRARLFGMFGATPQVASPDDRLTQATGTLQRVVVVKRSEKTYVLDVEVSAANPVKAARLANAIARSYMDDQQDARTDLVRRDAAWLNQRLEELQSRLQAAENKVLDFKIQHRIVDANGKDVLEQELADLATELGRVRSRSVEVQSRQGQIQKVIASGRSIEGLADTFKSPTLDRLRAQAAEIARQDATLRTTLGDLHPALLEVQNQARDTKRLIADELRRLSDVSTGDLQVARAAEAETSRRLDSVRRELEKRSQSTLDLRDLEREVEASRAVYERFLRAREGISGDGSEAFVARIIAPAVPPSAPSAPKRTAVLFIALAAGMFFGAGMALLLDYFDDGNGSPGFPAPFRRRMRPNTKTKSGPTIRYLPSQTDGIWSGLLGWMLKSRKQARDRRRQEFDEVLRFPNSPFAVALDALLDDLLASDTARRGRPLMVLVTGERKSIRKAVVASNLAYLSASRGYRTLFMEADEKAHAFVEFVAGGRPSGQIHFGETTRPFFYDRALEKYLAIAPLLPPGEGVSQTGRWLSIARDFDLVLIDGPDVDAPNEVLGLAHAVSRVVVVAGSQLKVQRFMDSLSRDSDDIRRGMVGAVSAPWSILKKVA